MKPEFVPDPKEVHELVLRLHYENIIPERIVEIVREKMKYKLSIEEIKKIISLDEEGIFPQT
jgi:hypothetical protein